MNHRTLLAALEDAVKRSQDALEALNRCVELIDEGRADHPRVETSALLSVARHQLSIAMGNLERARALELPRA